MSTVNNGPQIVRSGLVLDLDASLVSSYSAIAVYSVQCYSTFGGGLRSANYTVQYSDDNSTWTTAFTGVMSNDSSCGIITGTNRNDSNYSKHRYWRYVEGGAVVGHHPRVSRIDFITKSGAIYNLTTYTTDNCADSGTYIVGTVTKDFGTTTWRDTSGNGYNGTLTSGPLFNTSNKGNFSFNGTNQYADCGNVLASLTNLTLECFVKFGTQSTNFNGIISKTLDNTNGWEIRTTSYTSTTTSVHFRYVGDTVATGAVTLTNGVWYHLLSTGTSGSQILYVNGVNSISNSVISTPSSNTNSLVIGKLAYAGLYANMFLGYTRIYNKVLSATEVLQNYNALKSRFGL